MKSPPRLIYKYEQFSPRSLQNLKSQTIYFSSPRKFNDPYDCALIPAIETPCDEATERIRKEYIDNPALPPELKEAFKKMPTARLRDLLVSAVRASLQSSANEFLDHKGVTCFSEVADNLLMWSHYGDKSQGFCLEFDTVFQPFNRLFEVSYLDAIPSVPVGPRELFGKDGTELIRKLYCTKSKDWAYEREWRAIHQQKDTAFHYDTASLTGVYFGPESVGASQEIICLILQGQNENVRFYKGERSATEFKVTFKEFTYTPHIVAKRQGLIR